MDFHKYKDSRNIVVIVVLGIFLLFALYPFVYYYGMDHNPDLRTNGYYKSVYSLGDIKKKAQYLELLYPDQDYIDGKNCRYNYITSRFILGRVIGYEITLIEDNVNSITVKEKEYFEDDYLKLFHFKETNNGVDIYEYTEISYRCYFEYNGFIYLISGEEDAVIPMQRSMLDNKSIVLDQHLNTSVFREAMIQR